MSTDDTNVGTAIPGEGGPAPAAAPVDDIQTRAKSMGWSPREEFRGPAEKWVDADEFVRRGEEELPVLRERLRTSTSRISQLDRELARQRGEFEDKLQRIEGATAVAIRRQREELESSYRAAQREAVSNADQARYDQLERDRKAAVADYDRQVYEVSRPREPEARQLPPQIQSAVDNWRVENPWFERDPVLNQVAQAIHMDLNQRMPGLDIAQNLQEVRKEIAKRFPEKFAPPSSRSGPAPVEGGSRVAAGGTSRGRSAADLPADVRKIGERFVKQGLYKKIDDYAADYWSQDA